MQKNFLKNSPPSSHLSKSALQSFRRDLKSWFLEQQRDLPWRHKRDPYATWVAEVMLQQTLSAVVIPYFNRWMDLFPTLESLAKSPLDLVLKSWEGLGYYSRAKNLHDGAKYILEHFQGQFPDNETDLLTIKGIGAYTSKAILAFAFGQNVAPIDGNVTRVIARLFAIQDLVESTQTKKLISSCAESLEPDPLIAESLIELGATACRKKAHCTKCPVKSYCLSHENSLQSTIPNVKKRVATTHLKRIVAVVTHNNHFLVKIGQSGQVMEHLLEFPYLEGEVNLNDLQDYLNSFGLGTTLLKPLSETSHSFTRFQAHLTPFLFASRATPEIKDHRWIKKSEITKMPFSAGHRKILQEVNLLCV